MVLAGSIRVVTRFLRPLAPSRRDSVLGALR